MGSGVTRHAGGGVGRLHVAPRRFRGGRRAGVRCVLFPAGLRLECGLPVTSIRTSSLGVAERLGANTNGELFHVGR